MKPEVRSTRQNICPKAPMPMLKMGHETGFLRFLVAVFVLRLP